MMVLPGYLSAICRLVADWTNLVVGALAAVASVANKRMARVLNANAFFMLFSPFIHAYQKTCGAGNGKDLLMLLVVW